MRAKFQVTSYTQYAYGGRKFELAAVTDDGTPENQRYNTATPNGALSITIDNPAVVDFLEVGKAYYLDFTAVDPPVVEDVTPPLTEPDAVEAPAEAPTAADFIAGPDAPAQPAQTPAAPSAPVEPS